MYVETHIGLDIPDSFYRSLETVSILLDGNDRTNLYYRYCSITAQLTSWLLDRAPGPRHIIAHIGRTVVLQPSTDPEDSYWTKRVIKRISDDAGLDGL